MRQSQRAKQKKLDYPAETHGSRLAAKARKMANNLTREERRAHINAAMAMIYAGAKESEMSRQLGITVAPNLRTAWQMAVAETGPKPHVTVLPNSSKRLYVIFEIAKA